MSNQTIFLTVGQSHQISLRNNAGSTGYQWMVAQLPSGVYLEDIEDSAPTGAPMPGKPGLRVFTLVGGQAGKGTLRLVLARTWELPKVAQTLSFDVVVAGEHPPIIVLYGVALQDAAARGDLAEMKELAARAEAQLNENTAIGPALSALKAEIARRESAG